jgi:hypothetical protein
MIVYNSADMQCSAVTTYLLVHPIPGEATTEQPLLKVSVFHSLCFHSKTNITVHQSIISNLTVVHASIAYDSCYYSGAMP